MKIADILTQDDFIFALCSFIDEFKNSNKKYEMIYDEPKNDGNKLNRCILAAVAHKLSNDYNLDIPEWVNNSNYIMPSPVFSFNTNNKEFQQFLIQSTPIEFAGKNIYYGANAIERV